MNKFLRTLHRLIGCEHKNTANPDTLKRKITSENSKNIEEIKHTNSVIKVMIEKGEFNLKIVKK